MRFIEKSLAVTNGKRFPLQRCAFALLFGSFLRKGRIVNFLTFSLDQETVADPLSSATEKIISSTSFSI